LPDKKSAIHSEKPAADMANPRTLAGYISESKTQITTQMEIAQKKMYRMIRMSNVMGGITFTVLFITK
jgi:hypothetical protein